MAASCGRDMVVSFKNDAATPAYVVIGGLRTRNIAINAEIVDITNSDSTGQWRELLGGCGVKSTTMTGSGPFLNDAGLEAVRDAVFDGSLRDAKVLVPGFGDFEGKFKVSNLEFAGEYNGETTYSYTLESAGAITFTAAA